jgi:tRNA threonylcarbamoyl adenosine modification protein (Sua5/YciO/YrdC/YwlC family)
MTAMLTKDEAVRLLSSGEVVAVPTDTVYGLAASLAHPDAVAQLFAMKRRPMSVALPVLADSIASIKELGVAWGQSALRLSEVFWPGALTIVVAVPAELAETVGSTDGSVGFRVPNDEALRDVLTRCGPLALSSANEHGREPCHSAADVVRQFSNSSLVGVLDGGERSAAVSTVVRVDDGTLEILRQGSVSLADLENALA